MAMTYTSLVAPKGTAGSIMNWVNYSKLDIATVLDEAQSLLFQVLRVREMRIEWMFNIPINDSQIIIPSRFLDPIGDLVSTSTGQRFSHVTETELLRRRAFEPSSGSLGVNAISTTTGSAVISVHSPAHNLTVGSDFTIAGSTAVGGLSIDGTYKITSVTVDDFTIVNTAILDLAASTATGGGAAMTYIANKLIAGSPSAWALSSDLLMFDSAFDTATQCRLLIYQSPKLLSSTIATSFITNRYPMLLRKACQTAAADFMKDDVEYRKCLMALESLVQSTNAESDLTYRGAEFGTDTP